MFRVLAVLLLFMASYASAQQTTGPVQVANPPGIAVTNGQGINTTLITPNIGVVTGGDVSAATASGTPLSTVAGQAMTALQPSAIPAAPGQALGGSGTAGAAGTAPVYFGNGGISKFPANVVQINGGGGGAANAQASGGLNVNRNTWGNWNNGVVASFVGNDPGSPAQLSGFTTPSAVANYPEIDNAIVYGQMLAPPLTATVTNATFDASNLYMPSGSPLSAAVVASLSPGMFIATSHSPAFKGQITAIDPGGTYITVSGWFQQSNTAAGQNPQTVGTGPFTAYVNVVDHIYGANWATFLQPTSYASQSTSVEYDSTNNTGLFTSAGVYGTFHDVPTSIVGVTANCIGNAGCSTAFAAYGSGQNWARGYAVMSAAAGFVYQTPSGTGPAFVSEQSGGALLQHTSPTNGAQDVLINSGGATILGAIAQTPTVPYIDFHTSANNVADVRLIPSGGTGNYDGTLKIQDALTHLTGTLGVDGTVNFGSQTTAQTEAIQLHSSGSTVPDTYIYSVGGTAGTSGAGRIKSVAAEFDFYDSTNTGGMQLIPTSGGAVTIRGSGGLININTNSTSSVYLGTSNGNAVQIADPGGTAVALLKITAAVASGSVNLATNTSAAPLSLGTSGTSGVSIIHNGAVGDGSYTGVVATTGGSATFPNNSATHILDPAGTIATFSETLPAAPLDGQEATILCGQTITALTVLANSGQTLRPSGTSLSTTCSAAPGGSRRFKYSKGPAVWFPE